MSKIYTDLNTVLTPYATAIKKNASDITSLNGSLNELDDSLGWETIGSADASNEFIYPYRSANAVRMISAVDADMSIRSITASDLEHMTNVGYSRVERVPSDSGYVYRITEISPNDRDNDYSLGGMLTGLTPGKTYRLCMKVTDPQNVSSGGGHYCAIMAGGKTVQSLGNGVSEEKVFVAPTYITPSGTSVNIYIYPFRGAGGFFEYTHQVGDTFRIDDFYVNEINDAVDLFTHEKVFKKSLTGVRKLTNLVDGGMFIATSNQPTQVDISKAVGRILTINGESPDLTGNMIVKSHLQGKKCVCFGDSITVKGDGDYLDYVYKLKCITGLDTINAATGGTTMRYRNNASEAWNKISFAHIAEMIVSGDFSEVQALGNQNGFQAKARCADLYNILRAIDWNEVDYITLAYGANDFDTSMAYNWLDDTTDIYSKYTYLGSLRYSIKTILEEYPHIQFLVMTPVYRYWNIDNQVVTSDDRVFEDINGQIHYYDWGDRLKECAEDEMHVPVVDMYRALSINSTNALWFSPDGVHPDYPILQRMGSIVAGAMMSKF